MNVTDSQKSEILAYLKEGRSLTAIEALHEFNCFRLAARIAELRAEGHDILIEWGADGMGKRWGIYYLAHDQVNPPPPMADGQGMLL